MDVRIVGSEAHSAVLACAQRDSRAKPSDFVRGESRMATKKRPEKLQLDFEKWGKVTATLLWDKAPETCAAIVEAVQKQPVTARTLHAQYAGSELYFEDFPTDREIPFENTTLRMDENLYITNKHPGGVLAFYVKPAIRSFCFVYGEIIPRRTADVEIALNVFAEIDDKERAKEIGRESRWVGGGSVTISAVE
jgi:hypothetical protein